MSMLILSLGCCTHTYCLSGNRRSSRATFAMRPSGRLLPRVHVSTLRFHVTKNEIRTAVYDYAGVHRSLKEIQLVRMDEQNWKPEHCSCFLKIDNVSGM